MARPRRVPRGARVGPIPLGPLIVWQVVIALIIAGLHEQGWVLLVAAVALVVAAAATLVPWKGRVLWRWFGVWVSYRARGDAALPAPYDPMLGPAREWLPELAVTGTASRTGAPVGVVFDGTGYAAVLAPESEELIGSGGATTIPLGALARLGTMERIQFTSAQLVIRTSPAPPPHLRAYAGQLASSYDEVNVVGAPAFASWWLGLRLEPAQAVGVLGEGAENPAEVARTLRSSVTWTSRVLSSSGLPCRPLDEAEVREALTLNLGSDVESAPPHGVRRTAETWTSWSGDRLAHVTGWVRGWPRSGLAGMSDLLAAMAQAPGDSATAALTLAWPPGRAMRVAAYVRITGSSPAGARAAFGQFQRAARSAGCQVVRLDGEHLPGFLATVPFGGGVR